MGFCRPPSVSPRSAGPDPTRQPTSPPAHQPTSPPAHQGRRPTGPRAVFPPRSSVARRVLTCGYGRGASRSAFTQPGAGAKLSGRQICALCTGRFSGVTRLCRPERVYLTGSIHQRARKRVFPGNPPDRTAEDSNARARLRVSRWREGVLTLA